MKVGQKTDKGLERSDNQDDLGWFSINGCEIFIVADGMGGEAGGRTAASMAISIVKSGFEQGKGSIPFLLKTSIEKANRLIHEKGTSGEAQYKKMGTTIVAMAVKDGLAYLAHVGDSRIYRFRNGKLSRMTKDHSQVQQMVDDGLIKPEDAEDHPDSNIISRSIGAKPTVDVEISPQPHPILNNDMFLLCSDGLCGLVKDNNIESIILQGKSVDETCEQLVAAALNEGGHDNVTVQLILFDKIARQINNNPQQIALQQPIHQKPDKKTKNLYLFIALFAIIFLSGSLFAFLFVKPSQQSLATNKQESPRPEVDNNKETINSSPNPVTQTKRTDPIQTFDSTDPAAQLTIKGEFRVYYVKKGDSLSSIARKFKVDLEILQKLNGIKDKDNISENRELKIKEVKSRPENKSSSI